MTEFIYHKHTWEIFVVSFHKDSFCYSGHCSCHDEDFEDKCLKYELLDGEMGLMLMKVEQDGKFYHAIPLDREGSFRHIQRLKK